MNDEMKGKSGKVKVMYVRSDDDSDKRTHNPRTGKGGAGVQENLVLTVAVAPPAMTNRVSPVTASGKSRRGAQFPARRVMRRRKRPITVASVVKVLLIRKFWRRQRAEETRVYGENACQALFQSRPEAIVRAWFIQSVTPRFKEALRWMAANRKAYHVVDEAELTKASGTEHHGGVCFLIKKRNGTNRAAVGKPGRRAGLCTGAGKRI
ncbi:methyltransferase [Escherichia coli]|uniref:Methyltransferase n=1 Tax=Escherichia coli TaxID=562 RepID=A0A376SCL3_ECOLX|nr:methyltransferase [Escherichia coli]